MRSFSELEINFNPLTEVRRIRSRNWDVTNESMSEAFMKQTVFSVLNLGFSRVALVRRRPRWFQLLSTIEITQWYSKMQSF